MESEFPSNEMLRTAGALPIRPLVRQAYAGTAHARIGFGQGTLSCAEVALDAPWSVSMSDPVSAVASLMVRDDTDFAPVVEHGRFIGVVFVESVLRSVADNQVPASVRPLVSMQIPTCAPGSALVDAVHSMVGAYLRRIPVIGDADRLIGLLSLSTALSAADRDPAVRDAVDAIAASPSLFAKRWR